MTTRFGAEESCLVGRRWRGRIRDAPEVLGGGQPTGGENVGGRKYCRFRLMGWLILLILREVERWRLLSRPLITSPPGRPGA
jgi:hypothetical protein